tara:strand:- start:11182 stop:12858 length:1677 start_codon:yes stop_codon:yes gene_type:complete
MIRLITILSLLNINCLLSQSNEGEIEDAQILIEKNSRIILPKVDKSIDKIDLENNDIPKKKFEYNKVKYIDNSSDKKIDKILRDNTTYEEISNIFIDLRGGNYSSFIINTNPYLKIGNKLAVYSDLYIKLNSRGSKLSSLSGEEINDINLYIDYKYSNKSRLSSYLKFNSFSNGYYGYVDDKNITLDDELVDNLRFTNNTFKYKIDWENVGKKYNSNFSYIGQSFTNSFFNEFQNLIKANITVPISKNLISFVPTFESYQLENSDIQNPSSQNNLVINQLDLPILLDFTFKKLEVSFNSLFQIFSRSYLGKMNISSFSPSIKIKYHDKNFTMKITASRGYNYNKYSDEIMLMPFLYEDEITNQFDLNKEEYRIKGVLDLNIFNNSSLSLGFESLKVNSNLNYVLYQGKSLPSDIKVPIYLYTIERENLTQVINYLSLNYNTTLTDNLKSSIKLIRTIFEVEQVFQPEYHIDFLNTYSKNKISLSLGANLILENYGINFKNELFKMKSLVNIYTNGSYKINDNVNVNYSLNNILNRYNERFFMYPELGLNFMVGIKWLF